MKIVIHCKPLRAADTPGDTRRAPEVTLMRDGKSVYMAEDYIAVDLGQHIAGRISVASRDLIAVEMVQLPDSALRPIPEE